jgi:hypothetical protein
VPSPEPARFDPPQPYRRRQREDPFNPERHRARLETFVVVTTCVVWLISTATSSGMMLRDPNAAAFTVMLIDVVVTPVAVVVRRIVT